MAKVEFDDRVMKPFDPFDEQRRQTERKKEKRRKRRRVFFFRVLAAMMVVAFVAGIYYILPLSKVKSIRIEGNSILTDYEIQKTSGVDYTSRYLFVFSASVSGRLKKDPLIENAHVTHGKNGTIVIQVDEKEAIGYYWDQETPYLLLKDGTSLLLTDSYYNAMTKLPLIKDISMKENLLVLFADVNHKIIQNMAEIWPFVETYDPNMFRILMNDGNQLFCGKKGGSIINEYYAIYAQMKGSKACLFLDEDRKEAYKISCEELNLEEKAALEKLYPSTSETTTEEEKNDQKDKKKKG